MSNERRVTFADIRPSLEDYWRAVILFGRNVASYKFALGHTLLELAQRGREFVTLEELARPFSQHLCTHLKNVSKQGTFDRSRFLDACQAFNRGELPEGDLIAATARLGFNNVIDAFHVVNREEIPQRFFIDERTGGRNGIRLTEELFSLSEGFQVRNLPVEIEARWRLVETAWELALPQHVLSVSYDSETERLVVERGSERRRSVTGCRDALNGYQRGKCFYCRGPIDVECGRVEVDHFLPHALKVRGLSANLDGIWNLVLACEACNRGPRGKWMRVPELRFLERLYQRGEYLIDSHHPLRETLISQTGRTAEERRAFLQSSYTAAKSFLIHTWRPEAEEEVEF